MYLLFIYSYYGSLISLIKSLKVVISTAKIIYPVFVGIPVIITVSIVCSTKKNKQRRTTLY